MIRIIASLTAILTLGISVSAAEVMSSSSARMVLSQTHESELSKADLWAKLIEPKEWWLHAWSGDPGNMSLDLDAGGLWREDWPGGTAYHGEVLTVIEGEMLRLHAPFGPMQEMGLSTSLTLKLVADETGGSAIRMDFVANGAEGSGLDALAPAVDQVWDEALKNLVSGSGE